MANAAALFDSRSVVVDTPPRLATLPCSSGGAMLQRDITDNTLFYGDNQSILRVYIPMKRQTSSTWTRA